MSEIILYNGIKKIIDVLLTLPPEKKDSTIIWFGNAREVPLINMILNKYNLKISYVIDNDSNKWGKNLADVYDVKYYQTIHDLLAEPINISSPDIIPSLPGNAIFLLASRYNRQMKEQLLKLGIRENNILTFSVRVEDGIMKEPDVADKLKGCRRFNLEEMQETEFQILSVFDNYCREHKLRYFLAGGTLIGAVRHHGFIPWDDDIDVYMPYEDYLTFMRSYPKDGRYLAIDWENNDQYFLPFGKLMDSETYLVHAGYPLQGLMGVYIDIFPIAGHVAPHLRDERWNKNVEMDNLWTEYYIARDFINDKGMDIRQKVMDFRYGLSFDTEPYVGTMQIIPHQKQWAIDKRCYASSTPLSFKGKFFDAPVGYDEYLTLRYGNYMELPPEDQRITHSFYSYKKHEGDMI